MSVNGINRFSQYNPGQVSGNRRVRQEAPKPQVNQAPITADGVKSKALSELQKVMSTEEMKMFELLFSGEGADEKITTLSEGVSKRYNSTAKPQTTKTLGNFLDIRG